MNNTLLQIGHNGMGASDDKLSLLLVSNYLKLIVEEDNLPNFITFYNAGVKLLCTGSPVIKTLKIIEERGVKLIACKTCLDFFNLESKIEVGITGTMADIINLQTVAKKVINL